MFIPLKPILLDRQVHGVLFRSQCTSFALESSVCLIRKAPENHEANAGSQRTFGASGGEAVPTFGRRESGALRKLVPQGWPYLHVKPSTDGGRETRPQSPRESWSSENKSRRPILQARRKPFETAGELMSFSKGSDNR